MAAGEGVRMATTRAIWATHDAKSAEASPGTWRRKTERDIHGNLGRDVKTQGTEGGQCSGCNGARMKMLKPCWQHWQHRRDGPASQQ